MYGKHAYLNELQHAVPTRCSSDLYHYYGTGLWYGVKKRRVSISASHAKSATEPLRTHRRCLYDGRGRPQPLDGWPAGANMRRQDVINGESGNGHQARPTVATVRATCRHTTRWHLRS